MNWISIACAMAASETIEEILTHLWKVLVGQLHGPPGISTDPSTQRGRNLRDQRRIERRAGGVGLAYFWAVLMDLDHRKDLLREGWEDVGQDFVVAMVLDVICQRIVFRWLYPGEALLVATILPYLVVRGPVNRIASCRTKRSDRR
jgi:hypothetical protein